MTAVPPPILGGSDGAPWPSATTRLAGVLGHPVRHSLSPRLHQAAYQALGLDWAYLAFEVEPGDVEAAVAGARALGAVGFSVTMPHKEAAARLATHRSAVVRRLGAANTLTFSGRRVTADNTDGAGFVADLREEVPFEPHGRRCGVIGAGGAARAVILALAEAGAAEVLVVNRTAPRAFQAAALAPGRVHVARPEQLDTADLVVKATPVGMTSRASEGAERPVVDPARFGSGQLVVDLVYDPPVTEWLERAAASGARIHGGLGMLVHQAARQVELWSGSPAPLAEMWRAVGRPPASSS